MEHKITNENLEPYWRMKWLEFDHSSSDVRKAPFQDTLNKGTLIFQDCTVLEEPSFSNTTY